ncbi:recombinase family protein [Nocardioides sp. CER19]|uniref:recombinase family protein n=1 Tax=Nocardioides sp. CER19 TaxID=3038538 RepID=UPI00244AB9A9|nr:recombinase family protein [Nocardioides sp. CER19]MDH2415816.1 recombinase family protein [Nocardioides sp. CER19]
MATVQKRGGVYIRMSQSKGEMKIEQQEQQSRALARSHGIEVTQVYVDDGISASYFKDRPGWAQMLTDVQAGNLDVLLAQSEDRFTRQVGEKESLMIACVTSGVTWLTVNDGQVDPATADGEFFSTLRAGLARMESRRKAERQRQANDLLVQKGMPLLGGRRPFGYKEDKMTLHSVEAPMIARAYEDLISGRRTLSRIRTDWNAAKVPTVRGNPWDLPKVEKVLRRPKNAGFVQQRGGYDPEHRGRWEAIVDEATYLAALAILDDPRRRLSKVREAKHLCSSIARCGSCGTTMRVAGMSKAGDAAYRCGVHDGAAHKEQGVRHTSIRCADLDRVVTEAVLSAVLMSPGDSVPDTDSARLRALHGALRDVHEHMANLVGLVRSRTFSLAEVAAEKATLTAEADSIEAEIANIKQRNARAALMVEAQAELWRAGAPSFTEAAQVRKQIRDKFRALDLGARRALVRGLLTVSVHPGRGDSRVEIRHLVATVLNGDED